MAKIKRRLRPPVRLSPMTGGEFARGLTGLRERETYRGSFENVDLDRDFMINLNAKLFTGGTEPGPRGSKRYTGIPVRLPVNLGRMCNLDLDLLDAMGVELTDRQREAVTGGTCRKEYTGNFDTDNRGIDFRDFKTYIDGETALPGTPVGLKVEYDPQANDAGSELDKFTITPAVDFMALGTAGTAEQNRMRLERGKAPLPPVLSGRTKVVSSMPVRKSGYAGMCTDSLCKIVAKSAAANGLMTAKEPAEIPTPEAVEDVAKLYNSTFSKFVKDLSGRKGIYVGDPKSGDGIRCPSLRDMGLEARTVNGATVLAVTDYDRGSSDQRRDGLAMFNEAFNARWRQVVNEKVAGENVQSTAVVLMGNAMRMNARAVTARNPHDNTRATGLMLVQPGMEYVMTPCADKLDRSVGSALGGLLEGVSPEDVFDKDLMKTAYELSIAFDDDSPPPPPGPQFEPAPLEEGDEEEADQFKAICEAFDIDHDLALGNRLHPGPEDGGEEVEEEDWPNIIY